MFAVYLDESGTHKGTDTLSVGGYVATVEQWGHLAREWRDLLRAEGVTMFHMADLESMLGEFRGWNKSRQIGVISRIHGIIHRRVRIGVSSAVIKSHYDKKSSSIKDSYGEHYYTFCALDCMRHVANWADERSYNEPIHYVFEQGAVGEKELRKKLEMFNADEESRAIYRLGGWDFADKREVVQLQAADVIAYETWKQMENRIIAGERRPMRKSLFNLLRQSKGTPHISNYFNEENLSELEAIIESKSIS